MNISTLGSTFEISLRILLMLNELQGSSFDEQQIGAVDFISVYAADFGLLDENLHGYSNYRFSEYPARKYIVSSALKGLRWMGISGFTPLQQVTDFLLQRLGRISAES